MKSKRSKKSNRELLLMKCAREFKKFCTGLPWGSRKKIIDLAGEIASRKTRWTSCTTNIWNSAI